MRSVRLACLAVAVAAMAAVAAMVACSSGGGGGSSCAQVSPCGGSVTGTWNIVSVCATSGLGTSDAGSTCPGESEQITSLSGSGTITFNPDMTYSSDTTASATLTLTIPSSCLTVGGTTVSCSELQTEVSAGDGGTVSCNTSGSDCDCTISQTNHSSVETGTYSVSGSMLELTQTGSTPSTNTFCVQGNTMYLYGSGQFSDEIVLTKQ